MDKNSYANQCIVCTVTACKNHNSTKNFCALESIKVGTHETDPKVCQCTDCQSFEPKSGCC